MNEGEVKKKKEQQTTKVVQNKLISFNQKDVHTHKCGLMYITSSLNNRGENIFPC